MFRTCSSTSCPQPSGRDYLFGSSWTACPKWAYLSTQVLGRSKREKVIFEKL